MWSDLDLAEIDPQGGKEFGGVETTAIEIRLWLSSQPSHSFLVGVWRS